ERGESLEMRLVLHHEDATPPVRHGGRRQAFLEGRRDWQRGARFREAELDRDSGAALRPVMSTDGTPEGLDKPLRQGQAKPGAVPHLLRGIERLEDPLRVPQSRAVVLEIE